MLFTVVGNIGEYEFEGENDELDLEHVKFDISKSHPKKY